METLVDMMKLRFLTLALVAALPMGVTASTARYDTEVAPIFAAHCVSCHGPTKQKAGLRLDSPAGLRNGSDGGAVYLSGQPEESLLFQVVSGLHEKLTMPPKGDPLSEAEQGVLREWLAAGAELPETPEGAAGVESDHWAFQPVQRPELPALPEGAWGHNPIDAFTLARMREAGLHPNPEAEKTVLLRRLYLDLLGLPPEPAEVDAFLADESPDAYEKVVNRLLASPHYGERWGRHWLDLARYADSDGYEKDRPRPYAYRYRDWVINAINEDMPYDEFVVQQLAGDLLPGATLAQKTATGFHRNTLTNREGGIDPEEDRVKQAVDRANTTGAVFMGLTVACAQCHTHKYDPITQREYFGLYAFFDAALETDIPSPLPGEEAAYAAAVEKHNANVAAKETERAAYIAGLGEKLAAWEDGLTLPEEGWTVPAARSYSARGGSTFQALEDNSLLLTGEAPVADSYTVVLKTDNPATRALRLEVLTHPDLPQKGPGRSPNANFVLSEFRVFAAPADAPHDVTPVPIASATATYAQKDYPIENALDGDKGSGWAVGDGSKTSKNSTAEFLLAEPVGYASGTLFTIELAHHYGGFHTIGRFRLGLTGADPASIPFSDDVFAALKKAPDERSDADRAALLAAYGKDDETYRQLTAALAKAKDSAPAPIASVTMALANNPQPPVTRIHNRGDFLQPGAEVQPHTPAVLPPLKVRGDRPDRLDLAQWIVARENPLTARVAVNRVWEHLFGDGLARTSEDFGTRTEVPTHPQLLDWLAVSFMEDHHWRTKSLIKTILMSATYRQSSYLRDDIQQKDPTNRLLARQNRFRVEAEITRDLFLAASGLLTDSVGGPSVRPPVPEGVMNLGYANSIKWEESEGDDRYRRGLYIFFQRTVAYPMLMTFDCPDSNVSTLARNRSNTPLQSLTLLNDPVFVEAAQALAQRLLTTGPDTLEARVATAFKWCMGREPKAKELEMLVGLVQSQEATFAPLPEEAKTLVGPYLPESVSPATAAAHTVLARSIMNLDEFLTRE